MRKAADDKCKNDGRGRELPMPSTPPSPARRPAAAGLPVVSSASGGPRQTAASRCRTSSSNAHCLRSSPCLAAYSSMKLIWIRVQDECFLLVHGVIFALSEACVIAQGLRLMDHLVQNSNEEQPLHTYGGASPPNTTGFIAQPCERSLDQQYVSYHRSDSRPSRHIFPNDMSCSDRLLGS